MGNTDRYTKYLSYLLSNYRLLRTNRSHGHILNKYDSKSTCIFHLSCPKSINRFWSAFMWHLEVLFSNFTDNI